MALKRGRPAKKSRIVSVDFEGVEAGGGAVHVPPGEYAMKCLEAEETESDSGNPMIAWIFQGTEGKVKGKRFYFYTSLQSQALWKLRQTLEALGLECPDSKMDVDLEEVIGLEGIGNVEDDLYQGKTRSKLSGFVNGEGEEEPEEEEPEEEEVKPTVKKKKKTVVKVSADEVNEMSEEELDELLAKHELTDVDLSKFKTLGKKRSAVVAELEENSLLEE